MKNITIKIRRYISPLIGVQISHSVDDQIRTQIRIPVRQLVFWDIRSHIKTDIWLTK